jgi:transcriptional regulator with XRE-family HTH domain
MGRKIKKHPFIAERITAAFEGKSQAEIALELGVSKNVMSYWKSGKVSPRADILLKISRKTGVSIDWLLTGKEIHRTMNPMATAEQLSLACECLDLIGTVSKLAVMVLRDRKLAETAYENHTRRETPLQRLSWLLSLQSDS